jgi:Tol biopolymer transport system component
MAFHRHEDPVGGGIWLKDLLRGDPIRLTTDPSHNSDPVWSPDGTRIAFTSDRARNWDIYVRDASGTGRDQILLKTPEGKFYPSWSQDQRFLLFQVGVGASQNDLWVMAQPNGKPQPYLATPFNELMGQFSPDGRWVAYSSLDSGRTEVYVQPFPTNGDRYTISVGGGMQPSWRRDGREMFYLTPTGTMKVVAVDGRTGQFKSGVPQNLFDFDISGLSTTSRLYQPSPDGQRFLITERRRRADAATEPLTVVVDWTADLQRAR